MGNDNLQSRFGHAVRHLRNRLGITQEELAGRAGLHRTYVADIERGARNVSLESIDKLAAALEISLPALFAHSGKTSTSPDEPKPFNGVDHLVEIMLVEDNLRDVEMTLTAFQRARFTNKIQVARDGAAALALLFDPERPRPGLIMLDLHLPKVSGIEVLRQIKSDERTRAIPVVVLTVSQRSHDVLECQRLGADTYLTKPVGFQDFSTITPKLSLHWALFQPTHQHFRNPV